MIALDTKTGDRLWTYPATLVYDDVWAISDGAVYLAGRDGTTAVDVRTGDVRWVTPTVDPPDRPWPWHATDGRVFTIWNNLVVMSTDDGSVLWRTEYPVVEFPRMTARRRRLGRGLRRIQFRCVRR